MEIIETQTTNNARELGAFIGTSVTTFANADVNGDGKLQAGEIIGAVLSILLAGARVFDTFDDAIRELKTQGSPARKALLEGLATKFVIKDTELEKLLEDTLFFIENGANLTERWVAYTKRNEAVQG